MPFSLGRPGSRKQESTAYSAVEIDPNKSDTDVSRRSAPDVPGWPTGPERITSAPFWIVADIVMLLMPVAFIALAALAWRLDGKELSEYGRHIEQAILLGPTLFPLAFAALGGRSLKKIALWKAERGTTLGFLEHVIGSQSLVAAIGHAITLHSINFLTFGLLMLWALSPLGGQSALRLVRETNSTIIETRSIFYANVDASSEFPKMPYNQDAANQANAVVSTSLMTADSLDKTPVDTWNHPKIPRLEALEFAEQKNDIERPWYSVNHKVDDNYASLTGVDVMNLAEDGATNFTIPYEYMYFGCELSPHNNFTQANQPWFPTQLRYLQDLQKAGQLESGDQFVKNGTSLAPSIGGNIGQAARSFFIYTRGNATKPDALIFGSRSTITIVHYLFECSMNSVQVEANIVCEADSCGVERIRRLSRPRKERSARHLPYDVINDGYTARYFVRHFLEMGGQNTPTTPNPIDDFVYGIRPWFKDNGTGMSVMHNWTEYVVHPEKSVGMSQRLTRFLNTYWDASRWPVAITRKDPYAKISLNTTSGEPIGYMTMNKTEAIVTRQVPVYRANAGWVATLVVCSCVLLLLGIFSLILSLQTNAPDIFDYVSSFTRDSPYVNVPVGGSGMDGAERARLLRKLPIQLGDVRAGAETGYIAMRSVVNDQDAALGKVRREKMYE